MLTVILYGHLAKRFGRRHRYAIRTPQEAIRALCANKKGFREYLIEHSKPGYRVLVGKEPRDMEGLAYPADDVIKIVPVTAGAGRGLGQVILGAALIISAPWLSSTMFSANLALSTGYTLGFAAKGLGTALVLGGIGQMLTKTPSVKNQERPANLPSFVFNGAVNTTQQGNPVPVAYGRLIVGSQVISAGLSSHPA